MNVVTLTNGDETLIVPLERIGQVRLELIDKRVGFFKRKVIAKIELGLVMPEGWERIDITPKEAAKFIDEINDAMKVGRTLYSETYKPE